MGPTPGAAKEVAPSFPRFRPPPLPGGASATPSAAPAPLPQEIPPLRPVPLPVEKPAPPAKPEETGLDRGQRLREGLAKTRGGFVSRLAKLFRGTPKVDDDLRDDIEEVLFTADIGPTAAQSLFERVTEELDKREVADADAVWRVIRSASLEILDLPIPEGGVDSSVKPYTILMIGVNGVGKTTTAGKLAAQYVAAGRKVLLVAGDTFRAAAVEQLDVWARRVGCSLHRGKDKADPSSVIFEGIARGRREGFDVVLCDTAGRLHTRKELMDELAKVGRATAKALSQGLTNGHGDAIQGAHDTFLVLDATIGQNAVAQAKMFKETMNFTGLIVTKLDGTAKGGVVLGICDEMKIPIRYIGVGEGVHDLQPFDPEGFCTALFTPGESGSARASAQLH